MLQLLGDSVPRILQLPQILASGCALELKNWPSLAKVITKIVANVFIDARCIFTNKNCQEPLTTACGQYTGGMVNWWQMHTATD